MPQCERSLWRSRHEPAQSLSPAPQETTHMPLEQTWPIAQALPQAPQWARSLEVSRHEPPQSLCPTPQEVTHIPAEQT